MPNPNASIGAIIPLNQLTFQDVAEYEERLFIVTEKFSEDRGSGSTHVEYEKGSKETFVWDFHNPLVVYRGKGKIIKTIEWPAKPAPETKAPWATRHRN